MNQNKTKIFQKSSTTYFYSSLFFPKETWDKVATLYAYVRVADDFVDDTPQDISGLSEYIQETVYWLSYYKNGPDFQSESKDRDFSKNNSHHTQIIRSFVQLFFSANFKLSWLKAFLKAMASDIKQKNQSIIYTNRGELNQYIYGSAEVIGLFMCKILELPPSAYTAARLQGSAMQHINFIRDIAEDCELGRQYLPLDTLKKYGLTGLCQQKINSLQEKFVDFMRYEIDNYKQTQVKAELGYKYIPYRYRVPIATAAQLYLWTANKINKNPLIVFEKKVKPSKLLVLKTLVTTSIKELFRK